MRTPFAVLAGALLSGALTLNLPAQTQPPNRAERALTLTIGPTAGQAAALEIADAERSFARLGREKGIRDSFIAWFAPDGLVFEPGPTRVAEVYPKQPEAPLALFWGPDEVGASADGTIGFSSGPYLLRKRDAGADGAARHGRFLSVWKKQPDGKWKVAADFGAPGGARREVPETGAELAMRFTGFATPRPSQSRQEAGTTQTAFFTALAGGDWKSLRTHLHEQFQAAWTTEDGFQAGARIADEFWPALAPRGSKFEVTSATAAESGDFAYAHGRILQGEKVEGYWMTIWVREARSDRWQLLRLVRNKAG